MNTDRVGSRKKSMNYQRPSPARDNYFTTKGQKDAKGSKTGKSEKMRRGSSRSSLERGKKASRPVAESALTSRSSGPGVWVKKWVDYSSKYGLGYILSNGIAGVFFNDSTKIVLKKCGKRFIYIERGPDRKEVNSCYSLNNYPEKLAKKVKLLGHFKNYLGTSIKQ